MLGRAVSAGMIRDLEWLRRNGVSAERCRQVFRTVEHDDERVAHLSRFARRYSLAALLEGVKEGSFQVEQPEMYGEIQVHATQSAPKEETGGEGPSPVS